VSCRWSIEADRERELLRMTLSGAFTTLDVARLDLERKAAIGALKGRFNHHRALIDVRGCDLSSPDVAQALQVAIGNPVFRARRCAMVVGSNLVKMQARRVVQRPDMLFCESLDEAERWLLDEAA